jgi:3-deoxy-D-manno-octulosonic-acid transferase
MADDEDKARLIDRLAGAALARYIRYVRRTSRGIPQMEATVAANVRHHPCIVGMWHGEFMLLPLIKPPA